MARRNGRAGSYLFTDSYTGFTTYADKVQRDYWGNHTERPLQRNLQEISTPLNDPYPVPIFANNSYERTNACDFETAPLFIGLTNRPFPTDNFIVQTLGLDVGIGEASIGCTFVVR